MALFNNSVKLLTDVRAEIADSAGASADADMLTRANRSWAAAIEHFNGRVKWDFLLAESQPQQVIAPFGLTLTASAGQASASSAGASALVVDDLFSGSGWLAGTRVTATAASGIGLSTSATGFGAGLQQTSATAIRDYYSLPADLKSIYLVKLHISNQTLLPIGRRLYDRTLGMSEFVTGTPVLYDVFSVGGKGKIRLLPPPSGVDVLQVRYYRRMSPTAATIDVPQDYELYVIAWAKWHFLTDKGEGARAATWFALAKEGIQTMIADQATQPDNPPTIVPGHATFDLAANPNSTRFNDPW